MLPKNLRLPASDIPMIAKKGRRFENEFFYLKVWFDDTLENSQFAISISIKIDKRAAVRNRIKRKLRVVIVDLINENFELRKGRYLVVVKSRELLDTPNEDILKLFKTTI